MKHLWALGILCLIGCTNFKGINRIKEINKEINRIKELPTQTPKPKACIELDDGWFKCVDGQNMCYVADLVSGVSMQCVFQGD